VIDATSIRHRGVRQFIETGRTKGVPPKLLKRVINRLTALEAMKHISELPGGFYAHKLPGRGKNAWSVRVSGPWRLVFKFANETVSNLDLEQYH